MSLAEALMDEILSLPYKDPTDQSTTLGPETGQGEVSNDRTTYDNADDFSGYTEAAGSVADLSDTNYGGQFADFSRSVTATQKSETVTGFSAAVAGLELVITVTDSKGQTWSITRFMPEPVS